MTELCVSGKYPYSPHGRLLEIPSGRGVIKAKILEEKYEAKLEFPGEGVNWNFLGRGVVRGCKMKKNFRGGSMDINFSRTALSEKGMLFSLPSTKKCMHD